MSELHLRQPSAAHTTKPRVKPPPKPASIPVPFFYTPSDDGTDENLLILLHGLGDTHIPFSKLGRQLKLPQTAVLALRAPLQVPFLYEDAFQWYPSFTDLGEVIEHPNPAPALDLLSSVFTHLTSHCTWLPHCIHLFGFAQGGSVAAEFGIQWFKQQLQLQRNSPPSTTEPSPALGSVITISGPLLSYPTLSALSPTPLLVVHRPAPSESALPPGVLAAYKKAYGAVREAKMGAAGRAGMPASKEEWEPIMRFWSEKLRRRQAEGLYEVMSGLST